MFQNKVKAKLQQGQHAFGHWLSLPSPAVAELVAGYGMDWLLIDTEHGPTEWETVENMIRAMQGTDVLPLVRVAACDATLIKKALDRGAWGVVVPLVSSADQATLAVEASRYPPDGVRGVAGTRASRYGADLAAYLASWNAQVLLICQLETGDAVRNADAIAAVPGVDVLFVGPNDLSANLGYFRQFEHPEFKNAVARILGAAQSHGKAAGIMVTDADEALARLDEGFQFISIASDTRLLGGAVAAVHERIRARRAAGAQPGASRRT